MIVLILAVLFALTFIAVFLFAHNNTSKCFNAENIHNKVLDDKDKCVDTQIKHKHAITATISKIQNTTVPNISSKPVVVNKSNYTKSDVKTFKTAFKQTSIKSTIHKKHFSIAASACIATLILLISKKMSATMHSGRTENLPEHSFQYQKHTPSAKETSTSEQHCSIKYPRQLELEHERLKNIFTGADMNSSSSCLVLGMVKPFVDKKVNNSLIAPRSTYTHTNGEPEIQPV